VENGEEFGGDGGGKLVYCNRIFQFFSAMYTPQPARVEVFDPSV